MYINIYIYIYIYNIIWYKEYFSKDLNWFLNSSENLDELLFDLNKIKQCIILYIINIYILIYYYYHELGWFIHYTDIHKYIIYI